MIIIIITMLLLTTTTTISTILLLLTITIKYKLMQGLVLCMFPFIYSSDQYFPQDLQVRKLEEIKLMHKIPQLVIRGTEIEPMSPTARP